MLLLLGCLVGAVVYLCFSLGMIKLMSQLEPGPLADPVEVEQAQEEEHRQSQELVRHNQENQKIEQERQAWGNRIAQEKGRQDQERRQRAVQTQKDLSQLAALKQKLLNEIAVLEKELAKLQKEAGEGCKQELEAELQKILSRLAQLQGLIREREKLLAQMEQRRREEATLEELEKKLAEARKRREELQKTLLAREEEKKTINPKRAFAGTLRLENPMFVECKQATVIIYPQEKTITLAELTRANPYQELLSRHDGVVFMVRPTGYETFEKSLNLVQKLGTRICYEPIDGDWHIRLGD